MSEINNVNSNVNNTTTNFDSDNSSIFTQGKQQFSYKKCLNPFAYDKSCISTKEIKEENIPKELNKSSSIIFGNKKYKHKREFGIMNNYKEKMNSSTSSKEKLFNSPSNIKINNKKFNSNNVNTNSFINIKPQFQNYLFNEYIKSKNIGQMEANFDFEENNDFSKQVNKENHHMNAKVFISNLDDEYGNDSKNSPKSLSIDKNVKGTFISSFTMGENFSAQITRKKCKIKE